MWFWKSGIKLKRFSSDVLQCSRNVSERLFLRMNIVMQDGGGGRGIQTIQSLFYSKYCRDILTYSEWLFSAWNHFVNILHNLKIISFFLILFDFNLFNFYCAPCFLLVWIRFKLLLFWEFFVLVCFLSANICHINILCSNVSQLQRKSNLTRVGGKESREKQFVKFSNYMVMTLCMHIICVAHIVGCFSSNFHSMKTLGNKQHIHGDWSSPNIPYTQEVIMKKNNAHTHIRYIYFVCT